MKSTNYALNTTNFLNDDDRGFVSVCIQLFYAALTPHAPVAAVPAGPKKASWMERFDRWAAAGRERERERYLAASQDVFELEARIRAMERLSYF